MISFFLLWKRSRDVVITSKIRVTTAAMIFVFARAGALFCCNVPITASPFILRALLFMNALTDLFFCLLMRFVFAICICVCVRVRGSDFGPLTFGNWHSLPRLAFRICLVGLFSSQGFLMQ